jgi:uncharacterized protein YndB with AHSA1/START domain
VTDHSTGQSICNSIWIAAPPARVFRALSEGDELGRWWPMAAEAEPRLHGKLVLVWFSGDRLETRFDTFTAGSELSYAFYTERLRFDLVEKNGGTDVAIDHRCGPDAAIHVAQAWGFLKANLKTWVEHGIDLRTP